MNFLPYDFISRTTLFSELNSNNCHLSGLWGATAQKCDFINFYELYFHFSPNDDLSYSINNQNPDKLLDELLTEKTNFCTLIEDVEMSADLENYKVVEEADATKICLLLSRSCKPVHLAQFCHFDPKNVFFLRILSAVPGVHLIDMFPQKNNLFGFYAYHLDTSAHTLGVSIYDVEEDLPRFLKLASTRHLKFIVFRNINEEVDDLLFSLQVVLKLIKWWKKSFKPSESKNSVEVTTSNLRSFQEIFGEMCRCPKNKNSTLCVEASEFKGNKMLVDDFAKIHPSAVGLRFL